MKLLVAVAFVITTTTAVIFGSSQSCEERGGHYEYLESVTGSPVTEVCVDSVKVVDVDE